MNGTRYLSLKSRCNFFDVPWNFVVVYFSISSETIKNLALKGVRPSKKKANVSCPVFYKKESRQAHFFVTSDNFIISK